MKDDQGEREREWEPKRTTVINGLERDLCWGKRTNVGEGEARWKDRIDGKTREFVIALF